MKKGLIIAGSDTLSGGGLQTDIRTFSAHNLSVSNVLTCIVTLDSETTAIDICDLPVGLVEQQLQMIAFSSISVIKIGMLANLAVAKQIELFLKRMTTTPIILDPVLALKESGFGLSEKIVSFFSERLLPLADITTPNLREAELLANMTITTLADMEQAAKVIHQFGVKNVVIKGGTRLVGIEAIDLLYDGHDYTYFKAPKLQTTNNNGAGCTFASAIAANVANGLSVTESVTDAKKFVYQAINHGFPFLDDLGNVWAPNKM